MADEPDLLLSAGFSDAKIDREVQKLVGKYKSAGDKAGKEFNGKRDVVALCGEA